MRRIPKQTKPTESKRSRVDHVLATVGQWLIGGRYQPGETLPTEQQMSVRLGVSRNSVREAIKMLVGKGFVRTARRAGMIIQPRTQWNMLDPSVLSWALENPETRERLIHDLTGLRYIIETSVAALAATNATHTEILRMYEVLEEMEQHSDDVARSIECDVAFHTRLFEGAHNQLLASLTPAFAILLRANLEIAIMSGNFVSGLQKHRDVLDAIRLGDPQTARNAMEQLLKTNVNDLSKVHQRPYLRKARKHI
jgi:GntR family galactonate operon transcriptional repressor